MIDEQQARKLLGLAQRFKKERDQARGRLSAARREVQKLRSKLADEQAKTAALDLLLDAAADVAAEALRGKGAS